MGMLIARLIDLDCLLFG